MWSTSSQELVPRDLRTSNCCRRLVRAGGRQKQNNNNNDFSDLPSGLAFSARVAYHFPGIRENDREVTVYETNKTNPGANPISLIHYVHGTEYQPLSRKWSTTELAVTLNVSQSYWPNQPLHSTINSPVVSYTLCFSRCLE